MDAMAFFRDGDGDKSVRPFSVRPHQAAASLTLSVLSVVRLAKAGEPQGVKHAHAVEQQIVALDAWLAN